MKINNIFKYLFRFALLQTILTSLIIFYFDNFLISSQEFKQIIYQNLVEDTQRFFPFVEYEFITVDTFFALLIFIFLVILYSTKFYTYVNELSFSVNRNLLDEYFQIYLLWTSYLFMSFYVFRFQNVSRGYLFLFSFIVPLILLLFRNPEFISSLLGRSVTNENYISINLDENSNFRNLRIITFRKNLGNIQLDVDNSKKIIDKIDELNKVEKINLIVINLEDTINFKKKLEKYLIEVNKKVLLISNSKPKFNASFIYRQDVLDETFFTYFNNDIQYGSKYIIKRFIDILLGTIGIIIFSPIMLIIGIYIVVLDGFPFFIRQKRVGLHGEMFNMYKFRTMKKDSHKLRKSLNDLNKSDGPLFKIENDPRIIKSLGFVREYSLDELPQLINVLKGDMSLVGPRPLFPEDNEFYDHNYLRRLNVLPGITGLLQINDRNTSSFEIWYKYDLEYIENWNLLLDLKILLKTPFVLFKKSTLGK